MRTCGREERPSGGGKQGGSGKGSRSKAHGAEALPPKPALTAEQLQRIADLRALAAKKQKVAKLLLESDLAEEAKLHQKAAEHALAEVKGIEMQTLDAP